MSICKSNAGGNGLIWRRQAVTAPLVQIPDAISGRNREDIHTLVAPDGAGCVVERTPPIRPTRNLLIIRP